jgi:hypothetical protein
MAPEHKGTARCRKRGRNGKRKIRKEGKEKVQDREREKKGSLTLEDGADRLSRNVGNKLPIYAV